MIYVIVMLILGVSELLDVSNLVSKYGEIVLGYKRGEYREVEGNWEVTIRDGCLKVLFFS